MLTFARRSEHDSSALRATPCGSCQEPSEKDIVTRREVSCGREAIGARTLGQWGLRSVTCGGELSRHS